MDWFSRSHPQVFVIHLESNSVNRYNRTFFCVNKREPEMVFGLGEKKHYPRRGVQFRMIYCTKNCFPLWHGR